LFPLCPIRRAVPALLLPLAAFAQNPGQAECNRIFSHAFEHALVNKPIGEVVRRVGEEFLGKPYEAHTLDGAGEEQLVVDLRSFDCVTLVENALALSRCIKRNRLSFDAYRHELQQLRYRGGVIAGYESRLNYFTEWIADNARKGLVKDVTREIGGVPFRKKINFMSTHRSAYPRLSSDSAFAAVRRTEDTLSRSEWYRIPVSKIARVESRIRTGDIIAITTKIDGLDVSHTGIAVRSEDGKLRYLHAPDVGSVVQVTKETLAEHVRRFPAYTGILVARPVEPND
jgi:hypothetical protein